MRHDVRDDEVRVNAVLWKHGRSGASDAVPQPGDIFVAIGPQVVQRVDEGHLVNSAVDFHLAARNVSGRHCDLNAGDRPRSAIITSTAFPGYH